MSTTTLAAGHYRVVPLPSLRLLVCMSFNLVTYREQCINPQDGVLVPRKTGRECERCPVT
jgi:hypothetical protein